MKILYKDEIKTISRDKCNLITDYAFGGKMTSWINESDSDEEIAKQHEFSLQPERSKREDHESGCGALNTDESQ